jgi:HD-like signal output (HDOD) protein
MNDSPITATSEPLVFPTAHAPPLLALPELLLEPPDDELVAPELLLPPDDELLLAPELLPCAPDDELLAAPELLLEPPDDELLPAPELLLELLDDELLPAPELLLVLPDDELLLPPPDDELVAPELLPCPPGDLVSLAVSSCPQASGTAAAAKRRTRRMRECGTIGDFSQRRCVRGAGARAPCSGQLPGRRTGRAVRVNSYPASHGSSHTYRRRDRAVRVGSGVRGKSALYPPGFRPRGWVRLTGKLPGLTERGLDPRMEGVLRRLARWIGGQPAPSHGNGAAGARTPPPAGPRQGGAATPTPAPARPATAFTPFARALGVAEPEAPPAEEDDPAALELAARVVAHFQANRPGPASAPSLSLQILSLVAAPEPDMGELARLVSADPALSAGVLQVANSAAYRGLMEVETVRDALVRLGFDEVARVAGALSAKSLFNPKIRQEVTRFRPAFEAVYQRALIVANAAAWEAMQVKGGRADRAFLGGMLHDVGRSVALRSVAALALEGAPVPAGGAPLDQLLDRVHVELGGEAHQAWNLPQYLTVMAVRHHDPVVPADPEFADLHVVRLAAALHDLRADPGVAHRAAAEIAQTAGALGLTPHAVRTLSAELRDAEQRIRSTFGLDHP